MSPDMLAGGMGPGGGAPPGAMPPGAGAGLNPMMLLAALNRKHRKGPKGKHRKKRSK